MPRKLKLAPHLSPESNYNSLELEIQGKIKYILPADDGQTMAIQYVSDDLSIIGFYHINLNNHEIINEIELDGSIGNLVLKGFTDDYLLIVSFTDQNNPDVVDIFQFDWKQTEPTFFRMASQIKDSGTNWIEVPHRNFEGKTEVIDLTTGNPLDEKPVHQNKISKVLFPDAYTKFSQYFEMFEKLLGHSSIIPIKQCEYLKVKENLILTYYVEQSEGLMENILVILDNKGGILEKISLDDHLKGIGKGTFFVSYNKLIFVTQKNTLNVVEL
ncbi:MAG: hypothetical protein OCD76_01145 [Reichenbachiella sp.]